MPGSNIAAQRPQLPSRVKLRRLIVGGFPLLVEAVILIKQHGGAMEGTVVKMNVMAEA